MALGNNLNRIKKDSLIPTKEKEKAEDKDKKKIKSKQKTNSTAKAKSALKVKSKVKPAAKKVVKPKANTAKIKANKKVKVVTKPTSAPVKKIVQETTVEKKPTMVAHLNEKILLGGEGSPITIKLIPSRRKTVRKTKMIFEGSISLLEADDIKNCLLTTFNEYDLIDIQLQHISHLDLIPIQLIKAFISFYPDKKVKVESELPFDIKIIVERAGFGSFLFNEDAA